MGRPIIILEGDQTGQELLIESLRILNSEVIRFDVDLVHFDLSLENRRDTRNGVVYEAAQAIRENRVGLKAATITPADPADVGSPNAILREAMNAEIILRTGRRIPGVRPVGGVYSPISVVRMAVDDAYGAKEWRETVDGDEVAYRTEKISRRVARAVAQFAFKHARDVGAKVFGGPKFTVSATYEMLFKEELDQAALDYPDVRYEPQLIDATFALLMTNAGDPMVIPTLNRDGDLLSDLVLAMFGSIAGAESMVISTNDAGDIDCVMAEAPHGTAPTLEGRNIANPMAMILAAASLLGFLKEPEAKRASRAIREATLEAVYDGIKTADLGGHAHTNAFVDEVIRRVVTKLDVWETLGG